jgi:prophage regulatory protein
MSTRSMQDCTMTPDAPDRILRLNTVLDRTGLSRATLYRKIQCGTFPRQIKLSTRCAGWRESAINDWMSNPMFYTVTDGQTPQSTGA